MTAYGISCIVCRTRLESAFRDYSALDNQPYGGLAFQSQGHYGGTVFDPMDGTYLEISVCDPCLVQAGNEGLVIHSTPIHRRARETREKWRDTYEQAEN